MEIPFKSIAFQLGYGSMQIDAIYAGLGILNNSEPQKIPVWCLSKYKDLLLPRFYEWVTNANEDVIVNFEVHHLPINTEFHDWDLIEY